MNRLPDHLRALESEDDRLENLKSYNILDTAIDEDLEELNHLAATICDTPVSLIVLLDKDRQWFKSHYGWEKSETERSFSFCHYTILEEDLIFEVENAVKDDRFSQNPLVIGEPFIRYYCGTPLVNSEGYRLGSLCVIDKVSRKLSGSQKNALVVLSKQVVNHFELHKHKNKLELQNISLANEVNVQSKDLEQLSHELKTFIYKASHDIRGPIATIIGLSQLGHESTTDLEVQFYLKHILETGHRLDETLQNLLKIMSLKDNKIEIIDLDATTLKNAILKIIRTYKDEALDFDLEIDPEIRFSIDKELFTIIIKNLVDNSVKFRNETIKNSYIKIVVKEEKDNLIKINVEDNGEGIQKEIGNKVYDMFFRGSTKSKGSGLGLFIVKKAVEKLHGNIHFSSIPNFLTTFTVSFNKYYGA